MAPTQKYLLLSHTGLEHKDGRWQLCWNLLGALCVPRLFGVCPCHAVEPCRGNPEMVLTWLLSTKPELEAM